MRSTRVLLYRWQETLVQVHEIYTLVMGLAGVRRYVSECKEYVLLDDYIDYDEFVKYEESMNSLMKDKSLCCSYTEDPVKNTKLWTYVKDEQIQTLLLKRGKEDGKTCFRVVGTMKAIKESVSEKREKLLHLLPITVPEKYLEISEYKEGSNWAENMDEAEEKSAALYTYLRSEGLSDPSVNYDMSLGARKWNLALMIS